MKKIIKTFMKLRNRISFEVEIWDDKTTNPLTRCELKG